MGLLRAAHSRSRTSSNDPRPLSNQMQYAQCDHSMILPSDESKADEVGFSKSKTASDVLYVLSMYLSQLSGQIFSLIFARDAEK